MKVHSSTIHSRLHKMVILEIFFWTLKIFIRMSIFYVLITTKILKGVLALWGFFKEGAENWCFTNSRHLFLTVLETGKSRMTMVGGLASDGPNYCKQCCNEHWGTCAFFYFGFHKVCA